MNFYTRKRRTPTIIIVALIDIFVILLIFVIVTSTFKRLQPAVVLRLPEAGAKVTTDKAIDAEPPVAITVSSEGVIFLNENAIEVAQLIEAFRPLAASGEPIALRADTDAPFGKVIAVMDALKEAGVKGSLPAFTELKR